MTQGPEIIRYDDTMTPRRFRLERANGEVVETELIGVWRRTAPGRGSGVVGWMVRLTDGTEVALDELMRQWGETTLGTPDLHDE